MEPSPVPPPLAPPLAHSYWIVPGRLLAGEHPRGLTDELTRARLERLLEAGIDSFVDLTQPQEVAPYRDALPAGVSYLSKPIRDHGIPADLTEMRGILDCVRTELDRGRRVYLHCRAGIGRTATVAGCLLAERAGGEAALAQLNELWRQSGRSAQWPAIPETLEQTEYVRAWRQASEPDPLLEPATLEAARGLRERFHGLLLGLAVGDAVAAATQFGRPGRFAAVSDMLGGGPFDLPRGGWSDDTATTLCLAESLLECGGFDVRDQVSRYRRWQQHGHLSATGQCLGITAPTARALALAQWRRQAFSGTHDPQAQEPAALSRVAAAALYFFSRGTVVAAEQAAEAARTTSQVPAVLAACRSLAAALLAALCGRSKKDVLAGIEMGASGTPSPEEVPAQTAASALGAAAQAFGTTASFREAVLAAANLGGNSDVVAAVCGAIAGAHYGAGAIPVGWRDGLLRKPLIESFADRLLTHALLELGT